jgi:glyoxylase-like metal-dependent hydrolase (beta-lactamase superfamily II)
MTNRGSDHVQALRAVLKERVDGTTPVLPDRFVEGTDIRLDLGGTVFELRHRGGAHTPGDTMVWLPASNVLFTGDVVYVERMLGVLPVSNTKRWVATFEVIEQLAPARLVPGHGQVTDVSTARADTRTYLEALRAHMKKAVDDGTDISSAIKSFNALPYMRLLNAAELHPGNASRTYLELERE